MDRKIKVDGVYKHFKGNNYKVLGFAQHHETKEVWVIYMALYGMYQQYIRPLKEFASEVDRNKYPDVEQKYRFEEVK